MIKTNELRIGNLAIDAYSGRPLKVTRLSSDSIEFQVTEGKPLGRKWQSTPIPLTPELLKEAAFEPQGFNDYVLNGVKLSYNPAERRFIHYTSMMKMIVIPSLHQLQNLIFALTGEELDCKFVKP